MADGKIVIETGLSTDGIEKGIGKISGLAKTGLKTATAAIAGVSTALLGAGGAAAKFGSDFESSLAKASTLFGDVDVDTENLKAKILELSDSSGVAASSIGESLYNALSAGIPATEDMGEAMNYMESCTRLAKAGFTDVDTAVTATAKVLNSYKMDVTETDKVHKILMQTQNKGITTVGELGSVLAQVTPTAAAMNVSFEQVGAALATMTAQGTPAAQATTQLNSLFAELGKKGTAASKSLEKATKGTQYAGKSFSELMEAGIPLNEILDLMGVKANASDESLIDMFGSLEAGKAALAMSGKNAQQFTDNLTAMSTETDVVGDAYKKVTDTFQEKTAVMIENAKNLGISVYQDMEEPLKETADAGIRYISELTAAFNDSGLEGAVEKSGSIIADLAVKIAGSAPDMIKSATKLIKSFVKGIVKNKKELKNAAKEIVAELVDGLTSLLPKQLQEPVKKATEAMAKSFNSGGLRKSITTITTLFTNVGKAALNLTNAVLPPLTDAIDFLGDNLDIIIPLLGGVTAGIIAFKTVNTAVAVVQGLTTVMGALNAAMTANPVGLVIAGIAGLASIMGISTLATKDEQTETRILNDELHNQAEAVRETQKAREESVTGIENEYSYYQSLWDELQKNVDENGKIREGYEKRAAFITSTLSEALGIEIELNGDVIASYGELRDSIDQVIEKKKADAIISAYETDYQEAIKEQAKAQEEVARALKDLNKAKEDSKTADRQLAAVINDGNLSVGERAAAMAEAEENQAKANERIKEAEIAYKDAKTVASEYNTTIANYEEAVGAVESGSEDVALAIAKLSGNMKTASSAQAGELSKQVQKYRDSYENMKTAVADGGSGVTQEAVNQAQAMYYLSEAEYAKSINMPQEYIDLMMESAKCAFEGAELPEAAKNAMGEALGAAQQSLNDNGQTVISASQQIVDSTTQTWTNGNFKGIFSDEINSGINGANAKLLEGAETLGISTKKAGDTVNNSMKSVPLERDWYEKGEKATLSEAKGISEASGKVLGSVQHLTDDTKATLKNADLPSAGRKEGEGLSSGMGSGTSSNAYKATGAAEGMTNDVKGAVGDADLYGNAYRDGSQFSAGLAAGIYGGASGVVTAAVSVVGQAIEAAERKAQINSPSKKMEYVGKMYDAGMERGIDRNQGAPVKAAEELSENMLKAFDARIAFSSMRSAMSASLGRISENIILKSAIPRSQKSEGENKDTTINQTVNINQPVKTPIEMSRELKRAGKELAFG